MAAPDFYNIALDCVDKHADSVHHKDKNALIVLEGEPAHGQVTRLTFSSLKGLTNRLANAFVGLGVVAGERLVLRLPTSVAFPLSFVGAVKAGLIPIPSSPLLTYSELKFQLEDSEATVLVTTQDLLPQELLKQRPKTLKHIIVLYPKEETLPKGILRWENLLKESPAQFTTQSTLANDPAYWLYTSGTEGKPKAVIHAHRSIRAHDERMKTWLNVQSGDIIFNTSALNWSYGLTCSLLDYWRFGQTTFLLKGLMIPENILYIFKHYHISTFMSVPGIYRRLSEHLSHKKAEIPHTLRVCVSAGEKLSPHIRKNFKDHTGLEIYEGLGMTEHSVYLVQPYGQPILAEASGQSLPGQKVTVLNKDLTPTPPGEPGILATHQSCEGLTLGYHNRPESQEQAFQGEWFLSGDAAHRDEAGYFYFHGRLDDVITAGGYRISPLEVEAVLNQCDLVKESAVVGQEIKQDTTVVQAYVVLKEGVAENEITVEEIMDHTKQSLAKYKVPRKIIFKSELPKTMNGKIKRQDLDK